MSSLEKQIIYVFNKFTKSFIRIIKNDDSLKNILKKNYICFDKCTDIYLKDFQKNVESAEISQKFEDGDIKNNSMIENVEVLKEITVSMLATEDKYFYLHLFYLLVTLYKDVTNESDQTKIGSYKAILVTILKILNGGYEIGKIIEEEIYDERYKKLMNYVSSTRIDDIVEDNDIDNNPMNMIENSQIGKLAKEISSQIDLSQIDPANIGNLNELFSGDDNMMGNIIQQVSSVMTNKMQAGEINQEELMKEAMSMMGNLNNSGMMESMMGMMKNMDMKK
jgi:hypothetical protein